MKDEHDSRGRLSTDRRGRSRYTQLLDTRLSYSGYRVVTVPNGNEGLKAITEKRPDVVITDIMMPRLDGFGMAHRIRINPETRDIPVVFITATYVTPEDQEFALIPLHFQNRDADSR